VLRQYIDFITVLPPKDTLQPIHIKLDTGMRRLGFEEADIPELIEILNANNLFVKSVFSHLVASDNAEHDDFTHFQINLFEKLYNQITQGIGYKPWRHILNSGGITRFPEQHWEMVRLGIGLYGIDTSLVLKNRLTAVSTLKATISQIKRIKAGETVGYNRAGKAEEDKVIATISIGYADGFWRKLSNGTGEVLVRGRRAPVIGSICMDMTMIDVTKIPQVREGDEVIIFGSEIPVQELAAKVGTIPYEILTGISERVTRVCYED
jgi:alanine racemase